MCIFFYFSLWSHARLSGRAGNTPNNQSLWYTKIVYGYFIKVFFNEIVTNLLNRVDYKE